jgi:hypothetical protein
MIDVCKHNLCLGDGPNYDGLMRQTDEVSTLTRSVKYSRTSENESLYTGLVCILALVLVLRKIGRMAVFLIRGLITGDEC